MMLGTVYVPLDEQGARTRKICTMGNDEEPVYLIYIYIHTTYNPSTTETNSRKMVLGGRTRYHKKNKPNQRKKVAAIEKGVKEQETRVLTSHILSHRPNLIRRMHHNPFLVRFNLKLLFINNMLHTRRISTDIVARYQCLVLCTPALQHLDKVGQMTCIRAQTCGFCECGIGGVGGVVVVVGMGT